MALDFSRIPQNSRTIIFERYNEEGATNLCRLLSGQDQGDNLEKVNEALCVKSFEEFKKRFSPTVYEIFSQDENGNLNVRYSLDKTDGANTVSLCDHEFYRAVHDIAKEKSASAINNDNVDYSKLYEAMDPELIYKRARRRRKDVEQFVENALEEQDKGNPDGVRKWMIKAQNTFEDVKNEYCGSALRMLPLAVRDAEALLELSVDSSQGQLSGTAAGEQLKLVDIYWDTEGNLNTKAKEKGVQKTVQAENRNEKVLEIAHNGWKKTVEALPTGTVDNELFLSVYSEKKNTELREYSREELERRKEYYGNLYIAAQQSFCDAVSYLVQKVASLEQFFIHAGDENGVVESGVIIANCSIRDVLDNPADVEMYLKSASNNENDRIWFAVLPAAIDSERKWSESSSSMSDLTWMDWNFDEKVQSNGKECITVADISQMNDILSRYGILSFFNFNACEATGFKSFGTEDSVIKDYSNEIKAVNNKNTLVLAYPNFTIIPKNKRRVEVIDGIELYTPSIYIDAAYVAAGIVVATQNYKIQKSRFAKKVKEGRPFNRFNLEEKESSRMFATKFNPESRLNMDRDVANLLSGKNGNAFCFRSDSLENNAFVFTARTLNAKPIFWYITSQYLAFLLERTFTNGIHESDAKKFAREIHNVVENEAGEDVINKILRTGESFTLDEETKSFRLKFNGVDEAMEVNITYLDNDNN